MGREIRTIIDCNKGYLETAAPYGPLATGVIDDEFVGRVSQACKKNLSIEDKLKEVLGIDWANQSTRERVEERLTLPSLRWKILTADYYGKETLLRQVVRHVERIFHKKEMGLMFDGYQSSKENERALVVLKEMGARNTLCTGIPFELKERLLEEIGEGVRNLDPKLGLVMRTRRGSGINGKTGLSMICEDLGEEVHGFDDDLRIAVSVAEKTRRAHVWLPLSPDVAYSQYDPSFWIPPPPDSPVWLRVHFSHSLSDMARKLAA